MFLFPPSPLGFSLLSFPPSSKSAVCGTQWIPTLHWSCAVMPNQWPDLYWFSATCARRPAAARAPCSFPPPLHFFATLSLPLSPGATDAQCAVQSICHQLSAFSGAMMCGKMGGREGRKQNRSLGCGGRLKGWKSSLLWNENHIPPCSPLHWGKYLWGCYLLG